MGRPYSYKYGTKDDSSKNDILDDLFVKSEIPENINDIDDALQVPILTIDLNEVDQRTSERAASIAKKLSAYYFDKKYIDNHPYITDKIEQEIDNIRRLLKMLAINEKAQDTLIMSITTNSGKGALYTSLTSMQDSMLKMQNQLNQLTANLEDIFKEMQENCEKTFEEKSKEMTEDGMVVQGSREFIKEMMERMARKNQEKNEEQQKNQVG